MAAISRLMIEPPKKALNTQQKHEIIDHFKKNPPHSLKEGKNYIDNAYQITIGTAALKTFLEHVGIEIREDFSLSLQNRPAVYELRRIMEKLADTYNFNPTTELEKQNNRQMLCHGEKVLAYSQETDSLHSQLLDTYLWMGDLYGELGSPSKEIDFLNRALVLAEKFFNKNHPTVADCLNNLGMALMKGGEAGKAIDCFERALEIDKIVFGNNHPNVATNLYNIGIALKESGEGWLGIDYLKQAWITYEEVYGQEHPEVAKTLSTLGCTLMKYGHIKKAKACLRRALVIEIKNKGPLIATRLNNYGLALKQFGDWSKAIKCYERALAIGKEKESLNAALLLNNIGLACHSAGKLNRSIQYLEKAYNIALQFGEDHPTTKSIRLSLEQVKTHLHQKEKIH